MRRLRVPLWTVAFVAAGSLGAQTTPAARATPWTPFLGCWSTSSNGALGPMVCIVPTDTAARVEFMTVHDDSVVARTIVDASGRTRTIASGECRSAEQATWSRDESRLFVHAAVKCGKARVVRSDAMLSMTRPDAFTHIERVTSDEDAPARVVNFIVQLDTTVFPLEVRQRLNGYRLLELETATLEKAPALKLPEVVEVAAELDPALVHTWLADRGEHGELSVRDLRRINYDAAMRASPQFAGARPFFANAGTQHDRAYGLGYLDSRAAFGTTADHTYLTPLMVGFGVPFLGYGGGFTWAGWPGR